MTVGERVREIRKERGWTRVEFARRAGISRQSAWNAERDQQVNDVTLARIACAFGIPLRELDADAADRIADLAQAVS